MPKVPQQEEMQGFQAAVLPQLQSEDGTCAGCRPGDNTVPEAQKPGTVCILWLLVGRGL